MAAARSSGPRQLGRSQRSVGRRCRRRCHQTPAVPGDLAALLRGTIGSRLWLASWARRAPAHVRRYGSAREEGPTRARRRRRRRGGLRMDDSALPAATDTRTPRPLAHTVARAQRRTATAQPDAVAVVAGALTRIALLPRCLVVGAAVVRARAHSVSCCRRLRRPPRTTTPPTSARARVHPPLRARTHRADGCGRRARRHEPSDDGGGQRRATTHTSAPLHTHPCTPLQQRVVDVSIPSS
jgi:hypothetical protein